MELAPNLEAIQGNPTIHHHQVQAISLDQMHLEHGNYVILGPSHHVTTGEPLSEVTNVTITSAPSGVKLEVSKYFFDSFEKCPTCLNRLKTFSQISGSFQNIRVKIFIFRIGLIDLEELIDRISSLLLQVRM